MVFSPFKALGWLLIALLFGCSKALDTDSYGLSIFPKTLNIDSSIELVDEEKRSWNTGAFNGKWNLIFFGYTFCPDICPTTLLELNTVLSALPEPLARQVQVWFVTVDPERDLQSKLKTYVKYFNPSFKALSGKSDEIAKFARSLNMIFIKVEQEKGPYLMDHSASIAIINPKGDYIGFFGAPQKFDKMPEALMLLSGYF